MQTSRAPLIFAIVLLLLPLLYVGSYLALVRPGGIEFRDSDGMKCVFVNTHYSVAASLEHSAGRIFWPLEQIDRKVRPDEWLERRWLQKLPSAD